MNSGPTIERIQVSVYTIPTETPESDGTFQWDKTTMVIAKVHAGDQNGLGYSYADVATGHLIDQSLGPKLIGHDAFANGGAWRMMLEQIRNLAGRESLPWPLLRSITPSGT